MLGRELEEGAELPFAFEEHVERRGPSLYELRPLVRAFIEEREPVLRAREDARLAVEELAREPAAAIFARAHAGPRASEDEALFRTVLLGLLISTAEACGGFDWDDEAFEQGVRGARGVALREQRRYVAVAPLDRAVAREAGRALARASSCGRSSPASSPRTGPSRGGCSRATSAASRIARACVELRRELDAGEDAARRRRRDRGRGERAPAHDGGRRRGRAGAVRDARRAAVRDPAGASDRRDAAPGRVVAAGRVPRADCRRGARRARRRGRRSRARGGARPLGAVALPERAVPLASSSARRWRRSSARRGRCAAACCSRRTRGRARSCTAS